MSTKSKERGKTQFPKIIAVGHVLALSSPNCPHCGSTPDKHTVKNYDEIWHDGDVVCTVCNTKVRDYDAG